MQDPQTTQPPSNNPQNPDISRESGEFTKTSENGTNGDQINTEKQRENEPPTQNSTQNPSREVNTRASQSNKQMKCLNIDQVSSTVSPLLDYDANPIKRNFCLTPRSDKACLRCGVEPIDIMLRDVESFWQPGLDPGIQYMRSEAYNQMRESLLDLVRREYAEIMREISGSKKKESDVIKEEMEREKERRERDWEMREKMRVQNLNTRNQKEIEILMKQELQLVELENERKKKEENERILAQKRAAAEKRRIKEQDQRAKEQADKMKKEREMEEKKRKELALKEYQKEMELEKERQRQAKLRQQEIKKREEQLKMKELKRREKIDKIMEDRQNNINEKISIMEFKSKLIEERREEEKKRLKQKLDEEQDRNHRRILENITRNEEENERRRQRFIEKQRQNEERRRQLELEQQKSFEYQKSLSEQKQQRRQLSIEEAQRQHKLKELDMIAKQERSNEIIQENIEKQNRERLLLNERKRLISEAKNINLRRLNKVSEYQKMETSSLLGLKSSKVDSLLEDKKSQLEKRQQTGIALKRKQEEILKVIDEMRYTSNISESQAKLNKLLSSTEDIVNTSTRHSSIDNTHRGTNSRSVNSKSPPGHR